MVKINEFHNQESENLYPQPDYDVATDLMIYMREDPVFYRRKYFPALEDYKSSKKEKFLVNMIRNGLHNYCEKFGLPHDKEELLGDGEIHEMVRNIIADECQNG